LALAKGIKCFDMAAYVKKRFFSAILVLCSLVVALGIAELVTRLVYFSASERREGARQLWRNFENGYLRSVEEETGCIFTDTIVAHPYLSYVGRNTGDCKPRGLNNWGVASFYEMPLERDPNYFTVLFAGGSVAVNMYQSGGGPPILEKLLNEQYLSPNGKPFRLMGGSVGGWTLPQQYIFALIHATKVDAIIELDGYNEAANATFGKALDEPNFVTYQMAAQPAWATANLRRISFLQNARKFFVTTPGARNSFLAFLAWRKLVPADTGALDDTPMQGVSRAYALPPGWAPEKTNLWNKNRFKMYVMLMNSMSRTLGLKYAHFLQPMLSLDKSPSAEEKKFTKLVDPQIYQDVFVKASSELREAGIPSVSMGDVFKGQAQTIYVDQVHFRPNGTQMLAQSIINEVGALWSLKKRRRP
jgi:hypothetical protein